jgi:SnoaL-like polyketide cyclase
MLEENKAIVRRVVEEVNKGNLVAAVELLATDYIDHADPPATPPGVESAKQRWTMFRSAFPDARHA